MRVWLLVTFLARTATPTRLPNSHPWASYPGAALLSSSPVVLQVGAAVVISALLSALVQLDPVAV